MARFLLTAAGAFLGALGAGLFVLIVLAGLLASAGDGPAAVEDASVLAVRLGGALPERRPFSLLAGPTRWEPTLGEFTEGLEKAAADDRVRAVWLRVEGVEASWASLEAARRAVEAFRASGKPIWASSGPDGFSETGYFVASAADSVFAPPEARFELNGLFLAAPFFAGTLDKLGVAPEVFRAGAYKGAVEPFTRRDFSPENEQQYRDILQSADATFRAAVAEARRLDRARLDALIAESAVTDARGAARAGLLDGLAYDLDLEARLRAVTGQDDPDEALRTVALERYADVSRADAGLRAGGDRDIAVVYATGQILPGESDEGGATLGAETFVEHVEEALRDEATAALVLRIDSPGGSATASDVMWHAVREAAARVPVVVSMGGVAASGGYYIAAPAHTIVAEPNTITGSIGVFTVLFNPQELLNDHLGVTLDTLRTAPLAGLYSLTGPVAPAEGALIQRDVTRTYETFVARVAAGRDLPADSVRALGGGRVYTGTRAVAVGLADELGGLDRAVALAADRAGLQAGDYRLRVLPRKKPWVEQFLATVGLASASAEVRAQVRAWLLPDAAPGGALARQAAALERWYGLAGRPATRLPFDVTLR